MKNPSNVNIWGAFILSGCLIVVLFISSILQQRTIDSLKNQINRDGLGQMFTTNTIDNRCDDIDKDINTIWKKVGLAVKDRAKYVENPELYQSDASRDAEKKELSNIENQIEALKDKQIAIRHKYGEDVDYGCDK